MRITSYQRGQLLCIRWGVQICPGPSLEITSVPACIQTPNKHFINNNIKKLAPYGTEGRLFANDVSANFEVM